VDLLKKLRAQAEFRELPVVVFTNAYVPALVHDAQWAGANEVFSKATVTPSQIIGALRTALKRPSTPPTAGPVSPG